MNRKALLGLTSLIIVALLMSGCLNLLFPRPQTVSGTVKYKSGTPVVGAEVKLGTLTTKTNAQGQFSFTNVRQGTYDLSVVVDGKQVHTQKVTVGNQAVTVNVTLDDPVQYGTISGTVKYADDTPLPGVTVRLGEKTTTTDEEGRYEFRDVPYGDYVVAAEVDGESYTANAKLNAPAITVDIVVPVTVTEGNVLGVVSDLIGRPVENAVVEIGGKQDTTAANGQYLIEGLALGTYAVKVTIEESTLDGGQVTVDAATVTYNIELELGRLSGTVRDQNGDPVAGAVVKLDLGRQTTTDADGKYGLINLPYRPYEVTVEVDGTVLATETVDVNAPDVELDLEVTLPSSGPRLVYAEDFSGPGSTPADYGFGISNLTTGEWSVEEDGDGIRWIRGKQSGSWTTAYIAVPEIGTANRVILEYTIRPLNGNSGVIFAASHSNQSMGGNSYFSYHITSNHSMRYVAGNQSPTSNHHNSPEGKAVAGVAQRVRIVLDRVAKTLDLYVNDVRATGYPLSIPDQFVFTGPQHQYLLFYVNNSEAAWTDLKVWVED